VPRGFEWDRAIEADDRIAIIDQLQRLPAWVDHQLGTDNLDVKKLAGGEEYGGCGSVHSARSVKFLRRM
jgi:hypothetical protein